MVSDFIRSGCRWRDTRARRLKRRELRISLRRLSRSRAGVPYRAGGCPDANRGLLRHSGRHHDALEIIDRAQWVADQVPSDTDGHLELQRLLYENRALLERDLLSVASRRKLSSYATLDGFGRPGHYTPSSAQTSSTAACRVTWILGVARHSPSVACWASHSA